MKGVKSIRIKTTRERTSARTTPDPSISATLHDLIAARAHEIYQRRTSQSPLDDWVQAEQETMGRKSGDTKYCG